MGTTNYYEVAVEDRGIKQLDTLTYQSAELIAIGSVVRIELRKKQVNGVVFSSVKKPAYPTKSIIEVLYPAAVSDALRATALWIRSYYATDLGQVVSLLLPRGAHKKRRSGEIANNDQLEKPLPMLSTNQQEALATIRSNDQKTIMLHGITGSGKTRIYIERALEITAQKKSVIILVPEIGLTSQMVTEVSKQCKEVFVIHSNLTEADRHVLWDAIYQAESPVVIGPRSVLFSPLQNLGLIIIDEEHETSYKQDASPKYHAVHTAAHLARQSKAQLILGSATPRVEDYYLASSRKLPIITIGTKVNKAHQTDITTVDLRKKESFGTQSKIFSIAMLKEIDQALSENQQVLLFHNRRGSSTSVLCGSCGWVGECSECHMPLTHHADWMQLVCHVCNYRQPIVVSCPECASTDLQYKGIGTKQIYSQIQSLYPNATIARFDGDTDKKDSLEKRYKDLHNGSIQIIVGTQVIAKGLDLPHLKMVGVVLADTALYLPDFSANERAFQLLFQVLGRAGRHQAGTVVVQSYTPDHPAIQSAIDHDYTRFYEQEIAERELLGYPPFSFLLQLTCEYKQQKTAIDNAQKMAKIISADYPDVQVLGPSPAFYEQTKNGYRWQIVIKSKQRNSLIKIVTSLPPRWTHDLDPINLL